MAEILKDTICLWGWLNEKSETIVVHNSPLS